MEQIISPGEKLGRYLEDKGQSQREFARSVASHQSIISRIIRGGIRPGLDLAVRIERATAGEIATSQWALPPERAAS